MSMLRLKVRGFASSVSGQIALSLALIALPLILVIGSALDYGMLLRARSHLQQALDSATLAAAAKDGTLNEEVARSYFVLNGSLSGVSLGKVNFSKTEDGTVTGSLTAQVPAIFMKLARQKDYSLKLESTASGIAEQKQRNIDGVHYATGRYDIEFYQYSEDPSGKLTNRMLFMTYDYTYDPITKKATASMTKNPAWTSITVPKGNIAGMMLVVYADKSGRGQRINPDVLKSKDPDRSNFLRTEGDCWTSVRMMMYWEVTRDPNGDFKDAITSLSCTMRKTGRMNVRLVE